ALAILDERRALSVHREVSRHAPALHPHPWRSPERRLGPPQTGTRRHARAGRGSAVARRPGIVPRGAVLLQPQVLAPDVRPRGIRDRADVAQPGVLYRLRSVLGIFAAHETPD